MRMLFLLLLLFAFEKRPLLAANYDEQLTQLRNVIVLQQAEIMQLKRIVQRLDGTGGTGSTEGGSTVDGNKNLTDCLRTNPDNPSACNSIISPICKVETNSVLKDVNQFDQLDCANCVRETKGFQTAEYLKCKTCIQSSPDGKRDWDASNTPACLKK